MDSEQLNRFILGILSAQRCVEVFANSVAALTEVEMMKAANEERRRHDYADAYDEKAFWNVVESYGLGVNTVHKRLYH